VCVSCAVNDTEAASRILANPCPITTPRHPTPTTHHLPPPKKESATEGSAILATLTQPPLAPSNVVFAFIVVVAPAAALCVYLQNRRYSTAVLSMCLVSFISFQLVLFQFFFVD